MSDATLQDSVCLVPNPQTCWMIRCKFLSLTNKNKNQNKRKNHNHKIRSKNHNISNNNNSSSNNKNKNNKNSDNNINNKNTNENENKRNNNKFLEDLECCPRRSCPELFKHLVWFLLLWSKTLSLTFNHLGCYKYGVRSCPWHSIILDATLEELVLNFEHLGSYAQRPCSWITNILNLGCHAVRPCP